MDQVISARLWITASIRKKVSNMEEGKLREIGGKLDVSESDIKKIKKRHSITRILSPIIGAFVAFISTILGHIIGKSSGIAAGKDARPILINRETGEVYPYAITTFLVTTTTLTTLPKEMKKKTITILLVTAILTVIIAVVGYCVAHGIAYDNAFEAAKPKEYYSGAILYGVYSKETYVYE